MLRVMLRVMLWILHTASFGLKAQIIPAQGSALDVAVIGICALKGQLKKHKTELPFQGANTLIAVYPGRCPGLVLVGLSARKELLLKSI